MTMTKDSPWDEKILAAMRPAAVTFGWDDGEIRTLDTPEGTLDDMRSAWEWIDPQMRAMEKEKSRPRTICFTLTNGQFRGLRFPDLNTSAPPV